MGELVEHVEHPILASIVGTVLDKVVGPDMIAVLRPQPNARSVGQPEPAALQHENAGYPARAPSGPQTGDWTRGASPPILGGAASCRASQPRPVGGCVSSCASVITDGLDPTLMDDKNP
jgi:hypothetical protein